MKLPKRLQSMISVTDTDPWSNGYEAGVSDAWNRIAPQIEQLREALSHPDIQELDCECGWFEDEPKFDESEMDGSIWHVCIKCWVNKSAAELLLWENQE